MAKKFNLADYVQPEGVSNSDTLEIELLPWEKIHANEANFYAVDDVKELADSIAMHGLLDPVVVMKDWKKPGEWVLISGHRRHKAWGILREKDPEKYAQIPAIVRQFESAQLGELALIMANSATRKLTPNEVSRQAERVEMLLYELKEQGYKFPPGRMRDQVAAAVKVSSSKLARLKVIREGLSPSWSAKWESDALAEDPAYKLAQLSPDIQERIFKADQKGAAARGIEVVGKLMTEGNDYRCEALTGPGCLKCTHGDAFLRHDLDDPWNPCKGEKCCLTCEQAKREWSPCSRMCAKAKQVRTEKNARDKEKAEKEREREENKLRRRIREAALRLVKAADAAGVDDSTRVYYGYNDWKSVGWIRKAASEEDIGYQWENPLARLDIKRTAEALHCSADYVCGLTDELWPTAGGSGGSFADAQDDSKNKPRDAGGGVPYEETDLNALYDTLAWKTGFPPADGRYLCLVDMGGVSEVDLHEQMLDFKAGVWWAYGRSIDDMFTVAAWWPLPRRWEPYMGDPRKPEVIGDEDDD